ncbi:MAG: 3-oxoacyl-ACP reductase FabG [bacterium]|nr:3-oxoacyl-ACP reductase FabG [bacterium]
MNSTKVAIVTGGGRGIGRAISIELGKAGYYVIINYQSNDLAAAETLQMTRSGGGDGEIAKFDVRNSEETEKYIAEITSRYNNLEVLVNNAGIVSDGLFVMMNEDNWDTVIDTSLKGFFNMTKPVLKKMIRNKRGSIVSLSSMSGLIGNRGQANYSAAKAGIIGASGSVAKEVGRLGIRVNVVAPGMIDTDMIKGAAPLENIKQLVPMGRIGKPEEVAKLVRFLCSDDASYITGQTISINGGMF